MTFSERQRLVERMSQLIRLGATGTTNRLIMQNLRLTVLIILLLPVFGQSQEVAKIRLVRTPGTGIVKGIDFYNSETGEKIKSVDLSKINPYANLPYKVSGRDTDYGNPIYILDQVSNNDTAYLISDEYTPSNTIDKVPYRLSSGYSVSDNSRNYIAVAYELHTENKRKESISMQSTIIIFDSLGRIADQISHIGVNGGSPIISEDLTFVFLQMGGPFGCSGNPYIPLSFRVYDIRSKKMVYQDSIGTTLGPSLVDKNMFFVSNDSKVCNCIDYRIFDFHKKIVYSKTYEGNFSATLFLIKHDSVHFRDYESGQVTIEYFEDSFKKSKIK